MSQPESGLYIVADNDLPRVSDNPDLSSGENVREGGIAAIPARR